MHSEEGWTSHRSVKPAPEQVTAAEKAELLVTFAALILNDDKSTINAENINKLIKAAGAEVEPYWPKLFASLLEGQDVTKLLLASGGGGGGGGGGAPAADEEEKGGDKAPAKGGKGGKEEKGKKGGDEKGKKGGKPEKKEEPEEEKAEEEEDMGFNLFE